jgi:hypothetical protein
VTKAYRTTAADAVLARFPSARRAKIKARAAEIVAEDLGFSDLRKSKVLKELAWADERKLSAYVAKVLRHHIEAETKDKAKSKGHRRCSQRQSRRPHSRFFCDKL